MKRSIPLLCIALCMLMLLPPLAGAACNRTYPGGVIPTTYYSPGPYGTIYVESSPTGGVVYVNDDNKGHAPVTVTGLYPGSYAVTVKLAGYQDFTTSTSISGPTRTSVYCSLIPDNSGNGLYILSTPSSANVYVDGVMKGSTPLMMRDPAAGPHVIQVRLSGYAEWKSTVEAPAGGTRTITAILNQTDGDVFQGINVTSDPAGATIILDGLEKGVTPKVLNNIAAGIHILELEYPDYNSWKSTIDVPEDQIKEIPINLTPKPASAPGWITVCSSEENASVTLDGNYVGRTQINSSLNLDSIKPGEYTVVVALPGYKSVSTKVVVSPNLVSPVNATLVPVSGPLAKGALSVRSDPAGATVSVDNKSIGTSPITAEDLATGDHRITIHLEGYEDYSTSILVAAGTTRTVSATLVPVTSSLHSPAFPLLALAALGIIGLFTLRKKW